MAFQDVSRSLHWTGTRGWYLVADLHSVPVIVRLLFIIRNTCYWAIYMHPPSLPSWPLFFTGLLDSAMSGWEKRLFAEWIMLSTWLLNSSPEITFWLTVTRDTNTSWDTNTSRIFIPFAHFDRSIHMLSKCFSGEAQIWSFNLTSKKKKKLYCGYEHCQKSQEKSSLMLQLSTSQYLNNVHKHMQIKLYSSLPQSSNHMEHSLRTKMDSQRQRLCKKIKIKKKINY